MKAKAIFNSKILRKYSKKSLTQETDKIVVDNEGLHFLGSEEIICPGESKDSTGMLDFNKEEFQRLVKILKHVQEQPIVVTFNEDGGMYFSLEV